MPLFVRMGPARSSPESPQGRAEQGTVGRMATTALPLRVLSVLVFRVLGALGVLPSTPR
jgi:hypothetical protein